MPGRKAEPGIAYYKMNCGHTSNKKVRLLFNEFNADGYWIWQCIIDYAYSHKGYYFDCNDDDALELFATDVCKKQVSVVKEVIAGCIRRGLFSKSVFDSFSVLSSVMMQEIYLDATSERRRKGTEIELVEDLLLVEIPAEPVNISIVPWNNSILPRKNDNVPRSNATEYSRVKESKVENSKVNSNGVVPPDAGPPKKVSKKKQKEEPAEPYWQQLVEIWFSFNRDKLHVEPSFKDQDPKYLKKIVQQLKKRAEEKKIEWSEENATARLKKFLGYAFEEPWLKNHFLLENLLKQFDVIIKPKEKNGVPQTFKIPPKILSKPENDINAHYSNFCCGSLKITHMGYDDFDFMIQRGMKISEAQNQNIQAAVREYITAENIPNSQQTIESLAKRFAIIEHFKTLKQKGHATVFGLD